MALNIRSVRGATNAEWDDCWRGCGYATFFHSRQWAEIWSAYRGAAVRPEPLLVEYSDGERLLLPFSLEKAAFRRRYVSSPAGTLGGWIGPDGAGARHAELLVEWLAGGGIPVRWRVNPYDPLMSALFAGQGAPEVTHALDLASGFSSVYSRVSRGHRSKIKRALREGVSVESAGTPSDWDDYYAIYEDSLERWGSRASARYGRELFIEIRRRESANVKLWLARRRGRAVAGALCFYSPWHAVYWHGASSTADADLGAPALLLSEVIRDACAAGCAWFDFNPSGGHAGVVQFKERFGASPKACPMVTIDRPSARRGSIRRGLSALGEALRAAARPSQR